MSIASTIAQGRAFLEAIRWHDGRFWASDVFARTIIAVTPAGVVETIALLDEEPCGLGWLPDGALLAVSLDRHRLLRIGSDGTIDTHAVLAGKAAGHPNDMVTDAKGRAYVGMSGFDLSKGEPLRPGAIACVTATGDSRIVADTLLYPNGMVIMADGRTLVVAESFGQRLTAFTIADDGSLGERRVWAMFGDPCTGDVGAFFGGAALVADGLTSDAAGCIWIADAFAGRAVRVREGGAIIASQPGPAGFGVYACMLGGEDGRTLALCANAALDRTDALANRTAHITLFDVSDPHAGRP